MINMDEYTRLLQYVGQFLGENIKKNEGIKRRVGVSNAVLGILLRSLEQETEKEQQKWLKKIKKRLGEDIPDKYRGRKRPPQRLFPYRVSGDLYDEITTEVYAKKLNNSTFEIQSFVKFNSLHALLTDKGIVKGGITTGRWKGWMQDVLHGDGRGKGANGVPSIHNMLENLFSSKRLNKIINYYRAKGIMANKLR
jgi:hypothetical protein